MKKDKPKQKNSNKAASKPTNAVGLPVMKPGYGTRKR